MRARRAERGGEERANVVSSLIYKKKIPLFSFLNILFFGLSCWFEWKSIHKSKFLFIISFRDNFYLLDRSLISVFFSSYLQSIFEEDDRRAETDIDGDERRRRYWSRIRRVKDGRRRTEEDASGSTIDVETRVERNDVTDADATSSFAEVRCWETAVAIDTYCRRKDQGIFCFEQFQSRFTLDRRDAITQGHGCGYRERDRYLGDE